MFQASETTASQGLTGRLEAGGRTAAQWRASVLQVGFYGWALRFEAPPRLALTVVRGELTDEHVAVRVEVQGPRKVPVHDALGRAVPGKMHVVDDSQRTFVWVGLDGQVAGYTYAAIDDELVQRDLRAQLLSCRVGTVDAEELREMLAQCRLDSVAFHFEGKEALRDALALGTFDARAAVIAQRLVDDATVEEAFRV